MDGSGTEAIEARAMTAQDAVGLTGLVRAIYGEEYVHEAIYQPERFFAAQERGEHISEVAVTADGTVVGHWAFSFHGPLVVESGMTITHPDYRGHGIATALEENLMRRLDAMGVRWIMGEPVLFHTATQEIALAHWENGAITGFRLKAYHPVSGVGGFGGEVEDGRISVAVAFCPLASMAARKIWVSQAYRPILERVLDQAGWPRVLQDGAGAAPDGAGAAPAQPAASMIESGWDGENGSARIEVYAIGADIHQVVGDARDEAIGRGAQYIGLQLPVSAPESAGVDLLELGFSYAAFLPEMGDDGDVMLLQWLAQDGVDRRHWHLLNEEVAALADAVIAQAGEAFALSRTRS